MAMGKHFFHRSHITHHLKIGWNRRVFLSMAVSYPSPRGVPLLPSSAPWSPRRVSSLFKDPPAGQLMEYGGARVERWSIRAWLGLFGRSMFWGYSENHLYSMCIYVLYNQFLIMYMIYIYIYTYRQTDRHKYIRSCIHAYSSSWAVTWCLSPK